MIGGGGQRVPPLSVGTPEIIQWAKKEREAAGAAASGAVGISAEARVVAVRWGGRGGDAKGRKEKPAARLVAPVPSRPKSPLPIAITNVSGVAAAKERLHVRPAAAAAGLASHAARLRREAGDIILQARSA